MFQNRVKDEAWICLFLTLFVLVVSFCGSFLAQSHSILASANAEAEIIIIEVVIPNIESTNDLISNAVYSETVSKETAAKTDKDTQRIVVKIPAGLRAEQLALRLAPKFGWDDEQTNEFGKKAKANWIIAGDYSVLENGSPLSISQDLISQSIDRLNLMLQEEGLSDQSFNYESILTIASLIQRESGGNTDKALISGIIQNRLAAKMRLQIDAANQYIIGTPQKWWPIILHSDLAIDSLYNTYLYYGLPPTPIAISSLQSVKAALQPAQTDCFYYLHDHDGIIHCSNDYSSQLANYLVYLKK